MKTFARILVVATALLLSAPALEAQRPTRPLVRRAIARRAIVRSALADPTRRQAIKQRLQSPTPEQQAAIKQRIQAVRTERRQLARAVQSGQLTRQQARAQMLEWRTANRPQNPSDGRPIRP